MRLFDDEPSVTPRSGADWRQFRQHRHPQSGPPQDELGLVALAGFVLARTSEVAVAVRAITAYSDGVSLAVLVLFADEQRAEQLDWSLRDFSRSPGRFRFGVAFADGRRARTGASDAPDVESGVGGDPQLVLIGAQTRQLVWEGTYWLTPLPPPGELVVGCSWPDRGVPETLVQLDPGPLLAAAKEAQPVWQPAGRLEP